MFLSEAQRKVAKHALEVIADRLATDPSDMPELVARHIAQPLLIADVIVRGAVPHERLLSSELDTIAKAVPGQDALLNRLSASAFYEPADIEALFQIIKRCPNTAICISADERLRPTLRAAQAGLASDEAWLTLREEVVWYFGLTEEIKTLTLNESFRLAGNLLVKGYHPTPPKVLAKMLGYLELYEGVSVLEPSAGRGDIALALRARGYEPHVVEINPLLRRVLLEQNLNLVGQDFFHFDQTYDRIIQNPPFDHDIEHIYKAFSLLKPGGVLVSIIGEGSFGSTNPRSSPFRDWFGALKGDSERLDGDAFKDSPSPASVHSRIIRLRKPIEAQTEEPSLLRRLIRENAEPADLATAVELLDIDTLKREVERVTIPAIRAKLYPILIKKIQTALAEQPIRAAWQLADRVDALDARSYPDRALLQTAQETFRQAIGLDSISDHLMESWLEEHVDIVGRYGGPELRAELFQSAKRLRAIPNLPLLRRLLALVDNRGRLWRIPKMVSALITNETNRAQLRELRGFIKRHSEHPLADFQQDIKVALAEKPEAGAEDLPSGGDELSSETDWIGEVSFPLADIHPALTQVAWSISADYTRPSLASAWTPRSRTLISTNGHVLSRVVFEQDRFEHPLRFPLDLAKKIVAVRGISKKRLKLRYAVLARHVLDRAQAQDGQVYSVSAWIDDKSLGSYEIGTSIQHPPYAQVIVARSEAPKLLEFDTAVLQGAVSQLLERSTEKGLSKAELFRETNGVLIVGNEDCPSGQGCVIKFELLIADSHKDSMVKKQRLDYATVLTHATVYDESGQAYQVRAEGGNVQLLRVGDGQPLADWSTQPLFSAPPDLGQIVDVTLSVPGRFEFEPLKLDLKYLHGAVSACRGAMTYVSFSTNALDPVRFDSDGYTALVMPVRL